MGTEDKALMPIEEKQVDFYGDELVTVLVQEGEREVVYVPIRPLCDFNWGDHSPR